MPPKSQSGLHPDEDTERLPRVDTEASVREILRMLRDMRSEQLAIREDLTEVKLKLAKQDAALGRVDKADAATEEMRDEMRALGEKVVELKTKMALLLWFGGVVGTAAAGAVVASVWALIAKTPGQ